MQLSSKSSAISAKTCARKCSERTQRNVQAHSQQGSSIFSKLLGLGGKQQQQQTQQQSQADAKIPLTMLFPPYQVLQKANGYDLRLYDLYPVVTMDYENRGEGYATLGSYIDGRNSEGRRFPQTQPVLMTYRPNGSKAMSMYIGGLEKLEIASLPRPNDAVARLDIAGGELLAVAKFEGYITPSAAEEVRARLLRALERDGIKLSEEAQQGGFRVAQYGALYQLEPRLNELYLKVTV